MDQAAPAIPIASDDRQVQQKSFLRRLLRKPGAFAGLVVIAGFLVVAVFAPLIAPYSPTRLIYTAIQQPPSPQHLFGTDDLGRDVLSRVVFGARISMEVGVIAVAIAMTIGSLLGLFAGFLGGWADTVIMRGMDIMLAFPGILLAIAIVAILGPSLANTMIAVGISAIPVYARTVRAAALTVLGNDYIQAARALGASPLRVALKYVLPNVTAPITVLATIGIATSILTAAGLSYLGLGAQPPTPEWGAMLSEARTYLRNAWWMATFPGIAIMLVVMAFNLLGDGLRDLWDPRLRR
jgi:peptide/nickel transport system permease protein